MAKLGRRPRPVAERFWEKVDKTGECWLWTASVAHFGHGMFQLNGVKEGAHRVSWMLHYGPIPAGQCVMHRCDTPACVRPEHLLLGTRGDNTSDMWTKKRSNIKRGGEHYRAQLSDAEVAELRALHAAGGWTHQALADRYGVGRVSVTKILNGYTRVQA